MQDNELWRQLAEAKWGATAVALSAKNGVAGPETWFAFCQHRMCVKQHSRTTGGPTIRNAILGFLEAFPDPSAVLEASNKELEVVIGPLGLQEVRRKALQRMSHDFFATAWKEPSEFHGCGKFAADSWRIFCRGQTSPKDVEDAMLKRYLRWLSTGKLVEKAAASRRPSKGRSGVKRNADVMPPARTLRSGRKR
ncbi:g12748 [Coccomyxa viridis]|uniref:G12748 protein n=1 Tax=Coccomyxa viridis TaxID=1274662 RepID=A0ABP1GB43_9CHLO